MHAKEQIAREMGYGMIKKISYASILVVLCVLNLALNKQFFIELKMAYALRHEHIVVAFTTTPHRINKIAETVATILNQKGPIKKIYLSVPYVFKRDQTEYIIPKWISDNKKITILRTEDYGPATKLLGVLEKANLPANAIIITVDDDVYYPKNLVLQLAYKAMLNPTYAIGMSGANPNYDGNGMIGTDLWLGFLKKYNTEGFVDILQGYAGTAYRPGFFEKSIFDLENYPKDCITSDDLFFSFYLAKRGIPRSTLKNEYISVYSIRWNTLVGTSSDALHKLGRPADKHRVCLAYMKELDPQVKF